MSVACAKYFDEIHLGSPWGDLKRLHWYFNQVSIGRMRDYVEDITLPLQAIQDPNVTVSQYGHLTIDGPRYPLHVVEIGQRNNAKPTHLIMAGVHGYEPSGIKAAMSFIQGGYKQYFDKHNFVIYPCVSPWAYEYDHRWNAFAHDPNRLFSEDKEWADECRYFMQDIRRRSNFETAIDLHETPDRDIDLRKSRASRYGTELEDYWQYVPQGSYLMTSSLSETANSIARQQRDTFRLSVVQHMGTISPLAPEEKILGKQNHQGTTISVPVLGTTRAFLDSVAKHVGVTEVYSDHPSMNADRAVETQLAAIQGAVSYSSFLLK